LGISPAREPQQRGKSRGLESFPQLIYLNRNDFIVTIAAVFTEQLMSLLMQASTREAIEEILSQRILVLDGAIGSTLFAYGLTEADYRGERFKNHPKDLRNCHDLLVLTQPRLIEKIHCEYLEAGSDIIETNTFTATGLAMAEFCLDPALVFEINKR